MAVSAAERTDEYLVLPGCSTTSVKLREGRFEIKVMTGEPEPLSWSETIAGTCDTWVKWSRTVSDARVLDELTGGDDAQWVRVAKQRSLRLISLDGKAPAEIGPGTARLQNGCQFELTRVVFAAADRREPWWSFSFEAFGKPGDVRRNLESGSAHVFRNPLPMALPKEQSMSYPYWLMQCTQHS